MGSQSKKIDQLWAPKLIKIQMTGSGFLDLSTVKLTYDLYNDGDGSSGANQQRLLGSPAVFFSRCRILCGGTINENISEYNRVHTLKKLLKPEEQNNMSKIVLPPNIQNHATK